MSRKQWWGIGIMGGLWCLGIGSLQWWKLAHFQYNGLDLGIYVQAVWSLANGHGFASSIHDPSYLGDHVELWLVPIAGLYKLWSSPLVLLWTQTLILASAAIPLALLAKRILNARLAVIVTVVFFLHPLLWNVALYEFHGLVFALPILLWSILTYRQHRFWWWLATLLALCAVREDMPMVIAGWAVLAAIDKRWRWSISAVAIAIPWFLIAQSLIRHANALDSYKYLAFYRAYGNSYTEILSYPFRHPLLFLAHILGPNPITTIVCLLVAFGLLPLAGWRKLIPTMFTLAQLVLLSAQPNSILRLHYVIPFIPFLAWAALEGWKKLPQFSWWRTSDIARLVTASLVIAGPLYIAYSYGPLAWPGKARTDAGSSSSNILRDAVQRIQSDDAVLTTFNTLPSLAGREHIYSLNYVYLGRRQYTETSYEVPGPIDVALIDWQQLYQYQYFYRTTLFQGLTGPERIERILKQNGLRLASWNDSVAVYTKSGQLTYEPTKIIADIPTVKQLKSIDWLGGSAQLRDQVLEITSGWRVASPFNPPLSLRFRLIRNNQTIWQDTRLLGQGVLPNNVWQAQQSYSARYALAETGARHGDTLVVDIVQLRGRFTLNQLQTFRPLIQGLTPIGTITLPIGSTASDTTPS